MYPTSSAKQQRIVDSVCIGCEVREECLTLALLGEETEGVWGSTEQDRRELISMVHDVVNPDEFWDDACAEIVSSIASHWIDTHA